MLISLMINDYCIKAYWTFPEHYRRITCPKQNFSKKEGRVFLHDHRKTRPSFKNYYPKGKNTIIVTLGLLLKLL